jgi:hypothetical protein
MRSKDVHTDVTVNMWTSCTLIAVVSYLSWIMAGNDVRELYFRPEYWVVYGWGGGGTDGNHATVYLFLLSLPLVGGLVQRLNVEIMHERGGRE